MRRWPSATAGANAPVAPTPCRAGTTTPFHFGATLTTELANDKGTFTDGDGPKGEDRGQTTDVATFPANAWGLHDMHGNVWEWCGVAARGKVTLPLAAPQALSPHPSSTTPHLVCFFRKSPTPP